MVNFRDINRLILLSASLVLMIIVLGSNGAAPEEFNVRKLLSKQKDISGGEIIEEMKEVIDLYENMNNWSSSGRMWGSDIFRPLVEEEKADVDNEKSRKYSPSGSAALELEGVFIGRSGNSAVINGEVLSVGDRIMGMMVVNIGMNRVVLECDSGRRELIFDKD